MRNVLIKIFAGLIYLFLAMLLIRYITPLNSMILTFGSWLFFIIGPGGLEWVGSDYLWAEDPATTVVTILAVVVIAWLLSLAARSLIFRK